MSSAQHLREFISQRLTAAAEEIFTEFEKTIVQYEEEIDRQRRLLDITWKPRIKLPTIDLPQQDDCNTEEVPTDQLGNQGGNSGLDQGEPKAPQFQEQQEEEQPVLKEETDGIMVSPTYEETDHSETEPNGNQLLFQNYSAAKKQTQEGIEHEDFGSSRNANLKPKKSYHRNNVDDSPSLESQWEINTGKKPLKCDVCCKVFKYRYEITRHYRIHTGEKPYSCKTCGKSFSQCSSLNVHMRTHTGESFHCNTCGKSFKVISQLKMHKKTHTGEKAYFCKICGKSFTQCNDFAEHVRTHTDETPYRCETCGKSFSYKNSFLDHRRTHTGERPYPCKICGKSFTQSSHLIVHVRIHTGEKPYPCKMCVKTFKCKSHLTSHMRTHRVCSAQTSMD
ncbi:uncharacterized protein [Leuresthes tenuis]|uniref:uncharacterized protein n=1 Tax=Leuresthes tenuis TaxID=355514 RepID=UPI003B505267